MAVVKPWWSLRAAHAEVVFAPSEDVSQSAKVAFCNLTLDSAWYVEARSANLFSTCMSGLVFDTICACVLHLACLAMTSTASCARPDTPRGRAGHTVA